MYVTSRATRSVSNAVHLYVVTDLLAIRTPTVMYSYNTSKYNLLNIICAMDAFSSTDNKILVTRDLTDQGHVRDYETTGLRDMPILKMSDGRCKI